MAKRSTETRKGPPPREERISQLRKSLPAAKVKLAEKMAGDEDQRDIVTLAYLLLPRKSYSPATKLGARIEGLLEFVDPKQAEAIKTALLEAKKKAKE